MPRILVSLHNHAQCAGLDVARALRQAALPSVTLVAVTPGHTSQVADSDLFDETWTAPAWDEIDPDTHAVRIKDRLYEESFYLPTSPGETQWLAEIESDIVGILSPSLSALNQTAGPEPDALSSLPVSIPAWISATAPVEQIHAFGRRHNWRLWFRAPGGLRQPFEHWSDFDRLRQELSERTSTNAVYVQRRVEGTPLIIAFAATSGQLIDVTFLRRTEYAPHTYRWEPVPTRLRSALAKRLGDLEWTGGGSLRLVQDDEDQLWFDSWRPCFGSEVASSTQGAPNLPAQFVAGTLEINPNRLNTPSTSSSLVTIPPELKECAQTSTSPHRTPSPPARAPATYGSVPYPPGNPNLDDDLRSIIDDLPENWSSTETPCSVLLPNRTQERFELFADAAERVERHFGLTSARVSLSIKTNPSDRLLETARETGMLAETIHRDEMTEAQRHGFTTSEIVVNGPVQALLPVLDEFPYALFGDSLTDLDRLPANPIDSILGIRTNPPVRGPSRFGVDLSDAETMDRFCNRIRDAPNDVRIGLHLHAPASTLGHDRWWKSVARVLEWGRVLQKRTERPVEVLDLGGGWHPDDWLDVFIPALLDRRDTIQESLPELDVLLLEPGKALSQPLGVVISRVLDVRPHKSEVILDASLAELSNIDYHPHRLLAHTDDRGWHRLPRGDGRLLGRLCMEADVLGRARRVDHLSPGDIVVVCDAGAYDASMRYPFGRGHAFSD